MRDHEKSEQETRANFVFVERAASAYGFFHLNLSPEFEIKTLV